MVKDIGLDVFPCGFGYREDICFSALCFRFRLLQLHGLRFFQSVRSAVRRSVQQGLYTAL